MKEKGKRMKIDRKWKLYIIIFQVLLIGYLPLPFPPFTLTIPSISSLSGQQAGDNASSTTITTVTTSGKPWPTIATSPPTTPPPPPPETEPAQPDEQQVNKADEAILKWLLSNDPTPLQRSGISTRILKPLLKLPHIKEAIESLKQKLEGLDSQDPNDPEVKKVIKEFRTLIRKEVAKKKLKSIAGKRKSGGQLARTIVPPGLDPTKQLPLPAKPIVTNPPKHVVTQPPPPPPPPPTDEISPPSSDETTTTSSTTTTTRGIPQPDPIQQAILQAILQILQKKLNEMSGNSNLPQEIRDLKSALEKASQSCKEEVGKKPGGGLLLQAISELLNKTQWTDDDKSKAKKYLQDFCELANSVSQCSGVCSGGGGQQPPTNPYSGCYPGTTCSCNNTYAQNICKAYSPPISLQNQPACKDVNDKYKTTTWFNELLQSNPDENTIKSKFEEFKSAVCGVGSCRQVLVSANLNICE